MALRIQDSVLRGEIDNRTRGKVTGKLWLHAQADPVSIELNGYTKPDIAGCLFKFSKTEPTVPLPPDVRFNKVETGKAGEITASRKVRIFSVPMQEAFDLMDQGKTPPEKLANSVYLEWFSDRHGRVVVEMADCDTEISDPAWQPDLEEQVEADKMAQSHWQDFLHRLDKGIEGHRSRLKSPDEPWTEHDFELFFRQCDSLTDKLRELMEKYGDAPDAEQRIAEEMGWDTVPTIHNLLNNGAVPWPFDTDEDDEDEEDEEITDSDRAAFEAEELTHVGFPPLNDGVELDDVLGQEDEEDENDEENGYSEKSYADYAGEEDDSAFALDPSKEGIHWVRLPTGRLSHPLAARCRESFEKIWDRCEDSIPEEAIGAAHTEFLEEFHVTSIKLQGAMYPVIYQLRSQQGPFVVAYLKRVLGHLHKSQALLQDLAEKAALPPDLIADANRELMEIRQGILDIMQEQRGFQA